MTKYLKYIKQFSSTLYTGRADFLTLQVKPDDIFEYSSVVEEDITSINYNKAVWDNYTTNNVFSCITIADAVNIIPTPIPTDTFRIITVYGNYANPGDTTVSPGGNINNATFQVLAGIDVNNAETAYTNNSMSIRRTSATASETIIANTMDYLVVDGPLFTATCSVPYCIAVHRPSGDVYFSDLRYLAHNIYPLRKIVGNYVSSISATAGLRDIQDLKFNFDFSILYILDRNNDMRTIYAFNIQKQVLTPIIAVSVFDLNISITNLIAGTEDGKIYAIAAYDGTNKLIEVSTGSIIIELDDLSPLNDWDAGGSEYKPGSLLLVIRNKVYTYNLSTKILLNVIDASLESYGSSDTNPLEMDVYSTRFGTTLDNKTYITNKNTIRYIEYIPA
ncbi:MAG: hypothetical protein JHC33_03970 [Ignisphaera sp.]|nr:hypothetical protein [Ignisphaera sp.]